MLLTALLSSLLLSASTKAVPIDRHALVSRHNVVLTKFNGEAPLQVGNGEFAFGMDITGLQTFAPFNTMSQWGWNSSPLPPGQKVEDYQGQVWDTHGRPVRYPMEDPEHAELSSWLAANPHRINLGRVGLELKKKDGTRVSQDDLQNPKQTLELWTGIVTSHFEIEGEPVTVTTACDPKTDTVAVHIESPLVAAGRLSAFLDTPGNSPLQFANFVGDSSWPSPIDLRSSSKTRANVVRKIDEDVYHISLSWKGDVELLKPDPKAAFPIEIVSARYGAKDMWMDVTERVKNAVRDGRVALRVTNWDGIDPAPKVEKDLVVTYLSGGKTMHASAHENDEMRIGPTPPHGLVLQPGKGSNSFSFVCAFSPKPLPTDVSNAEKVFAASRKAWPKYWKGGGAIDLSGSADPRWKELERRIVLSQYLMKVNEAGSLPPQESGLVNNGWFGRFHMEMMWWHATHWALWNHWTELDKSLNIYEKLLPKAKKLAQSQGYKGARWPKCIGPNFVEWPHQIHSLLIWQQPHPIFFAELDYRAHPTKATLKKWQPIVEATADFLSTYAFFDKATQRYVLGPPIFLVSENTDPKTTQNPTFELSYWRFGLRMAQEWRKRLGLAIRTDWEKVLKGLAPLPELDGMYVLHEGVKDMWTNWNFEHPALTGVYGLLPGDGVDKAAMRRTLDKVTSVWRWDHTWGWDFPMLAMCAARLGETDRAVDLLLHPAAGFQFDERGLATGGPFPYFPSNGGLLYAVAMMARGWDGGPKTNAPGFPRGKWSVRWENLSPAP